MQELLNNAAKHSQASHLQVHMTVREDMVQLQYSDDGIGLDIV
ncbi:ATP-binding protein [Bacillus sp. M6-12]